MKATKKDFEKFLADANEQMGNITEKRGNTMVPQVVDEKKAWDIFSKLLDENVLRLDGQVNDGMAAVACASLMFLSIRDPDKEIKIMINSPGGSVYAGLAIYDTMRMIPNPIHTQVFGMAASMGSLLLAGGDIRSASANARIMIHQPLGGNGQSTQATDMRISADSIEDCWEQLSQIYVNHTGVPHEHWDKLLRRDHWLNVEQAKELGLVQHTLPVPEHKKAPFEGLSRVAPRTSFNEEAKDLREAAKKSRIANEKAVQKANDNGDAKATPAAKKSSGPAAK